MSSISSQSSSILDLIPDIIYRLDSSGLITYISKAITTYGYTVDELIGKSIFEIVHPEDRDKAKYRLDERRISDRRTRYFEVRLLTKDQESVPFEMSAKVADDNPVFLLDAKGIYNKNNVKKEHFRGTLGIAKNITERKNAEDSIRKSEKKCRTFIEDMPALLCRFLPDGTLSFVNNAYCTYFDKKPEELLGHNFFQFIPENEREKVREHYGSLTPENPMVTYEHTVYSPDGTMRCQRWTDRVVCDDDGNLIEYQSVGIDITERKHAEELVSIRLRYEKGLAATSKCLLEETEADNALSIGLQHLLEASGASRVYLFENFTDTNNDLCTRQTHEVCAPGITCQIDNPVLQHVPYKILGGRWKKTLSNGDPIIGLVETFPEKEREILEPQGIQSILVLPILMAGVWYGFIGFDDTESQREWNEEDIRLLRLAAEIIWSYIERKKMEEHMRELATEDGLTGTNNRRYFLELAEKELERAKRFKHSFSLLIFDIDLFKNVNDSFGHGAGDEVLKKLVEESLAQIRDIDILGRIGGEEFTIILVETDLDGAVQVAERLRKAIESTVIKASGKKIRITVSIGVAKWSGKETMTKLLVKADNLLYKAKRDGRNCVRW